jgi:hypothetical protein
MEGNMGGEMNNYDGNYQQQNLNAYGDVNMQVNVDNQGGLDMGQNMQGNMEGMEGQYQEVVEGNMGGEVYVEQPQYEVEMNMDGNKEENT